MPIFDLKKIEAFQGVQNFYQLTIDDTPDYSNLTELESKNDRKTGVLDLFEDSVENKYIKDIEMIYAYMERVSNNEHVPGTKYHILDREKSDTRMDFEFKHGDLRVYGIQTKEGKVIVLGGYKNNEKANIRRLRSLKDQYFESLKPKKK